jgi:hypothetical protein
VTQWVSSPHEEKLSIQDLPLFCFYLLQSQCKENSLKVVEAKGTSFQVIDNDPVDEKNSLYARAASCSWYLKI